MTKNRLEAFSDGVFSISITLLAFNIKIPDTDIDTNAQLIKQLWVLLPTLLTFIFSFLAVGIFWVAHNRVFQFIKEVDHYLMWLNIFYLMCIAIMPFPAYILARHPFLPAAMVLYCTLLLVCALFHLFFLRHLLRKPELQHDNLSPDIYERARSVGSVGPVCYVFAIASNLISPVLSFVFIAFALIFYIFIVHRFFKLPR